MSQLVDRLQLALRERRTVSAIAWFVTLGVLLYLATALWFGWREIAAAFTALGLPTLLMGAVCASSAFLWRFGRWEYALRVLGHAMPRCAHLRIYLAGLALTATPAKSGETFRSALLLQHGVRGADSLAAFLVDRGSDVLGMVLLGTLAALTLGHSWAWAWLGAFAALLLASMAFALLLTHRAASNGWQWAGRCMPWLPARGAQATLASWANLWKLPRVAAFSLVALLAYGTQALVFSWFCHILATGITVADSVLIFVQATLFGAASMVPGGLGAMEAALAFQLIERGVTDGIAISLAIAIRLVTLWVGMILGIASLLFLPPRAMGRPASE